MTTSLLSSRRALTAPLPKQAAQFVLRMYQRFVSPMLPHSCRFVPTCSEYAMEAIERHGVLRGLMLAAGRLLRCHPFARAGLDPVPVLFEPGMSPADECEKQIPRGLKPARDNKNKGLIGTTEVVP